MNLADLTLRTTPIIGAIFSLAVAADEATPWWSYLVVTVAGFGSGLLISICAACLFGWLETWNPGATSGQILWLLLHLILSLGCWIAAAASAIAFADWGMQALI